MSGELLVKVAKVVAAIVVVVVILNVDESITSNVYLDQVSKKEFYFVTRQNKA